MHQCVAPAVVRGVTDPQQQGVAHDHVRVREVDPGTQHVRPVGNSPAFMRASRSRFSATDRSRYGLGVPAVGHGAAMLADLVLRLAVDVGLPLGDQADGNVVQLLEVVAGVELGVPLEAQPPDVALDGLDVLDVLGERVGVVEAQVHAATELPGDAEIQADRLGVPDVRIAVGLGWEPRADGPPELAGRLVLGDHL